MRFAKHPLLAICALGLALSGCVSVGAKQQHISDLLTLVSEARAPVGGKQATLSDALTINVPTVPLMLSYTRIPVYTLRNDVQYLRGAAWVEPPARLFRALLAETISAKTGRIVLDTRQIPVVAHTSLSGQLTQFGIDETSHKVVISFDALLTRNAPERPAQPILTRRFIATAPVETIDAHHIGAALNAAANDVATQVSDWLKTV